MLRRSITQTRRVRLRVIATAGIAVACTAAVVTGSALADRDGRGYRVDSHPGHGQPVDPTPAVTKSYPVVREGAVNAPQYTVYRPIGIRGRLPVVVFGNGACNHQSDVEFIASLSLLASHGFVVVAEGYYAGAPASGVPTGVQPQLLTGAIDWAQQANRRGYNELGRRLDLDKVAVAGQSCGGLEALVAGADPRVKTVLSLNSGFFPTPVLGYGREELAKLHTPVLFVEGGPTDVAYLNTLDNYALVTVPAIHVGNTDAGHTGLWHNTRNDQADSTITLEADIVVTQYLDFTLNGNRTARAYFLGTPPGILSVPKWSVESKGF